MNHTLGGGCEDSIRETLVADCPREDEPTYHRSEGRDRVVIGAGSAGSRHQLSQEIQPFLEFGGEGIADALRLSGNFATQRGNQTPFAGGIAMNPRQVSRDDGGKGLLTPVAFQQATPKAPRTGHHLAHSFGCDGFLGAELAVHGTVRQPGVFGDRVNPGGADAAFAKQASGRTQYLLAILRRPFLRDSHPVLLDVLDTLDTFDDLRNQYQT